MSDIERIVALERRVMAQATENKDLREQVVRLTILATNSHDHDLVEATQNESDEWLDAQQQKGGKDDNERQTRTGTNDNDSAVLDSSVVADDTLTEKGGHNDAQGRIKELEEDLHNINNG